MHLLTKLIEKNLEENFVKRTDDVVINTFHFTNPSNKRVKQYYLTLRHLKTLQIIMKDKVESVINVEDEKFTIAGGSVLTLLMYGSPFLIRDIDFFPNSLVDYTKLKAKLDAAAAKRKIEIYENGNSRCYKFNDCEIDLVKKFYDTPDDCIRAFDIDVCKVAFEVQKDYYFHKRVRIEDIFNFRMSLSGDTNGKNAYARLRRLMKYASKGFQIGKEHLMMIYATIASGKGRYDAMKEDEFGILYSPENELWREKFDEAKSNHMEGYHHLVAYNGKIDKEGPVEAKTDGTGLDLF